MEDPQPEGVVDNDDDANNVVENAAELQQRLAEEAMEKMLLAQEEEGEEGGADGEIANNINNNNNGEGNDNDPDFAVNDDDNDDDDDEGHGDGDGDGDDIPFLDDEIMNNGMNFQSSDGEKMKNPFTYVRVSFWSAIFLVFYAFRSRQQWYLALVFLSSSKWSYVILGNALIASLIWSFQMVVSYVLNGLRLHEAEGLSDFFRWHITEACLALTIFRSELNVKTAILFLVLVFAKCIHWVVDMRESHLRMTEEVVVVHPTTGWIALRWPHVKLLACINMLAVFDIIAVVMCGQNIMTNGPTVSIFFAFESLIMLTSVISNSLLWYLHMMDGIFHYLHEKYDSTKKLHSLIHPWKDHKATLIFAVELQAQAAKFMFYLTFFAIVMTYYGLPINLIREVYVSFHSLKTRLIAFNKYRKLMSSMNRFKNPSTEDLEEEHICIICRDEMTVETSKKLPGCGHM
jgi:E3 ubiquitin-protein ligase synoviolin